MPVVYDNVGGAGRGTLFQGLKLWISLYVPTRARFVQLVENNGGEVVKLEKNADMLIADNRNKRGVGPPAGSYSYKWIEFCVKNGCLQDKEDYQIQHSSRDAGSSAPAKSRRTPFTEKDDLLLTKWVMDCESRRRSTQGNEIYKEFERKHRHHTWQSWRDRWVKTLSARPRPHIAPDLLDGVVPQSSSIAQDTPTAVAADKVKSTEQDEPVLTQQSPTTPRRCAVGKSTPATDQRPVVRGRNPFTPEDDSLLLEYMTHMREKGEFLKGNKIYQVFADQHTNHTWHSWRDRWLKHLSKKWNDEADAKHGEGVQQLQKPKTLSDINPANTGKTDTKAKTASVNATSESLVINKSASSKTAPRLASAQLPDPKSDDERLKRQEAKRKETRAAKVLQRTWRGHAVRRTVRRDQAALEASVAPTLQALVRGYLARKKAAERLADLAEANMQPFQNSVDDLAEVYNDAQELWDEMETDSLPVDVQFTREQFYSDLRGYVEVSGAEVDGKPIISGQRVDLWDIFRIASQQECSPRDRDWGLVAHELGFDWAKFPHVVHELLECYNQNLADFEDALASFHNEEDGEEEEEVWVGDKDNSQTSDAVTRPKQPLADPTSPDYRSSPPIVDSKQSRRYKDFVKSDSGYPSDESRKRRKLDRNAVIPPTPEHKLGMAMNTTEAHETSSPLKSRGTTAKAIIDGDLSSEKDDGLLYDDLDDSGEAEKLPEPAKSGRKKLVEPETQDWCLNMDDPQNDAMEAEGEFSPSEQLQMESDARSSPKGPEINEHDVSQHVSTEAREALVSRADSHSNARELGSNGQPTGSKTFDAVSSSSLPNGKATRRTLPGRYQKRPAATASIPDNSTMSSPSAQARARLQSHNPAASFSPTSKNSVRSNGSTALPSKTRLRTQTVEMPSSARPSSSTSFSAASVPQSRDRDVTAGKSNPVYDGDYVEAQLNHFVSLGYIKKHVAGAMKAASFQRGPMSVALQSLHNGNGLPENERGVWTSQDDRDIKIIRTFEKGKSAVGSEDGRMKTKVWTARNRLEEKHGKEAMKYREEFMELWKI